LDYKPPNPPPSAWSLALLWLALFAGVVLLAALYVLQSATYPSTPGPTPGLPILDPGSATFVRGVMCVVALILLVLLRACLTATKRFRGHT
jgi:hypothetical protein